MRREHPEDRSNAEEVRIKFRTSGSTVSIDGPTLAVVTIVALLGLILVAVKALQTAEAIGTARPPEQPSTEVRPVLDGPDE